MSADLKNLTTAEIVDAYNKQAKKIGEKPVKRFANRATAIKRTTAILKQGYATSVSVPSTKVKKSTGRPSKELNLKPRDGRAIREGSLAEKAYTLLKKGATRDQLAKLIGGANASGRVRTLLLRMNTYNGIGISQTGDRFKAVA